MSHLCMLGLEVEEAEEPWFFSFMAENGDQKRRKLIGKSLSNRKMTSFFSIQQKNLSIQKITIFVKYKRVQNHL